MTESNGGEPATDLTSGHTVHRYDQELAKLRGIILEMGERVLEQTKSALDALHGMEEFQAYRVLDREPLIDYLSLDVDEEVFRVITRRQPAAIDLRIVLALSKISGEVERAGDKATRIARQTLELSDLNAGSALLSETLQEPFGRLESAASEMLERCLRSVAAFDVTLALGVFEDESALYQASGETRNLIGEMDREDLLPRQAVCLLTISHALERIGNHSAAIAEQVIYVALGQDVRYRNREILIDTLRHRGY